MDGERARRRQLALLLAAVLLFDAPLLAAVDGLALPGGAPLTPLYLFAAWLAVIGLCALNVAAGAGARAARRDRGRGPGG